MEYVHVWGIAALAGIACLGFFFLVTRRISNGLLRSLLRCLAMVWLLLPAPVPNYPGQFAPAYVVWIFEGILQRDGEPLLALQILLWSSLAVVLLVVVWYVFFGRHRTRQAGSAEPQHTDTEQSVAAAAAAAIRTEQRKRSS